MLSWVVKNLHNSARRHSRTGFSLSPSPRSGFARSHSSWPRFATGFSCTDQGSLVAGRGISNRYSGIKISPNSHRRNTYAISNRYKMRLLHAGRFSGTRFSYPGSFSGTRVSFPACISGTRFFHPGCACVTLFLDPAPSLQIPWPPRRLIANPRLKFALTHCKLSPLRISNRERMALSSLESSREPLASNPQNPYTGPSAEGDSSWKIPSY